MRRVATVGAPVVVVVAVVGLVAAFLHQGTPQDLPDPGIQVQPTVPAAVTVPAVTSLTGSRGPDGSVTFTWSDPAPQGGDRYQWGVVTATGEGPLTMVDEPTALVPAAQAPGEVCIQVLLVRSDGRVSADATRGCAG